MAIAALAVLTSATVAEAQPVRVTAAPRCRDCDTTTHDSTRGRVLLRNLPLEAQFEVLMQELLASRLEVEQLMRRKTSELTELGRRAQEERMRTELQTRIEQIDGQIGSVVAQQNALRDRLSVLCSRVAVPEGWMGVGFQATYRILTPKARGPVVWRFEDYPRVVTVDDDSPAERAGVRRGDRILMIDGRELRDQDIVFANLLKPGERLPLRIERDGQTKDVTILVAPKPASADVGCSSIDVRLGGLVRDPQGTVVATARGGRAVIAPRGPYVRTPQARTPSPAVAPTPAPSRPVVEAGPVPPLPAAPVAPTLSGGVLMLGQQTSTHSLVLGVDMTRLNAGLADRIGVDRGVLVLDVLRGTPGDDAGLVAGDVIVSVNGVAITTPTTIVRAVLSSDDRTVRLGVIRKDAKKPTDVVVSW